MVDNRNFLFKNQAGGAGSTMDYSSAGATAAVTAFQQGGVNALLAFLSSYQGGSSDPLAAFEYD